MTLVEKKKELKMKEKKKKSQNNWKEKNKIEENVEKSIDNKITENVKFYKYQETDLSKFKIKEHIYNFILFESVDKKLFFINVSSDYISVYDFLTYEKTFQIKYPFLDEIEILHFFDTINRRDLIIEYTVFKRWSLGELMIWDFRNWKCLYNFSDYCKNSKFAKCEDIYPNDACLFNVDNKNYIIIYFCLIENNKKETGYIYAFYIDGNKIKEIVPGKSGEISISKYYDKILMKNFIIIYYGSLASYDFNQKII